MVTGRREGECSMRWAAKRLGMSVRTLRWQAAHGVLGRTRIERSASKGRVVRRWLRRAVVMALVVVATESRQLEVK